MSFKVLRMVFARENPWKKFFTPATKKKLLILEKIIFQQYGNMHVFIIYYINRFFFLSPSILLQLEAYTAVGVTAERNLSKKKFLKTIKQKRGEKVAFEKKLYWWFLIFYVFRDKERKEWKLKKWWVEIMERMSRETKEKEIWLQGSWRDTSVTRFFMWFDRLISGCGHVFH